jgi:hypothetical protein
MQEILGYAQYIHMYSMHCFKKYFLPNSNFFPNTGSASVNYTQQQCHVLLMNLIPWRDSNPSHQFLRRMRRPLRLATARAFLHCIQRLLLIIIMDRHTTYVGWCQLGRRHVFTMFFS